MPTNPTTTEPTTNVDAEALRSEVRLKYTEVANNPNGAFHFHTGRRLAELLDYPVGIRTALPDEAMASFAGVDNPFGAGRIPVGGRVVDLGSGGGFDCLVAAELVGPTGSVIGVDMTPAMLDRSRRVANELGLHHVEFRQGILETLPVADGWADVVISNGVLNLSLDKTETLREWFRVLKRGGRLQAGDILVERPVPQDALEDISLWTG